MVWSHICRKLGAHVEEISIPMHAFGPAIFIPIVLEGSLNQMNTTGYGTGHKVNRNNTYSRLTIVVTKKGLYVTSMIDTFARGNAALSSEGSITVKACWNSLSPPQNQYLG